VRKNNINVIMSHPSYGPKRNAGNNLAQNSAVKSRRIKIPNTIVRNVKITINLVGGVHAIFFTN